MHARANQLSNKEIFGLVRKGVNKCEKSINFNKQVPRPTVAFAKAEDLNQTVPV